MAMIDSLWTWDQIALSALILACCAMLLGRAASGAEPIAGRSYYSDQVFLATCAALVAFLLLRGGSELGIRVDSWSDANVIISGRNYAREGLFSHFGAAQHQTVTPQNPSDPFYLYQRYPVGSNLVNGLLQILGAASLRVFRLVPSACSLAAIFVWRAIFRRFVGRDGASWCAVILATSYGFLAYADALMFHAYAFLTTAIALECYLRAVDCPRRRTRWMLAAATATFIGALFTWEYHLWIITFLVAHRLFLGPAVARRWILAMILPLGVAMALQSAQRRAVEASYPPVAMPDTAARWSFLDDVYRRTIGFESAVDTPRGVTLAAYPARLMLSFFKFYGISAIGFVALAVLVSKRAVGSVQSNVRAIRFLWTLIAAGAPWWFVMMQHTSVHAHVMRHMLPAYCLLTFLALSRCINLARSLSRLRPARLAAGTLVAVLLVVHVEGTVANLRLHLQRDWLDRRGRMDAGPTEGEALARVAGVVPPGSVILTDCSRVPLMRYWTGRPVYSATPSRWPRDVPGKGRMELELALNHLRQLYRENLPPLYFVYWHGSQPVSQAYRTDPLFRFFVSGTPNPGEEGSARAAALLEEAFGMTSTTRTFCPIVLMQNGFVCFQMGPAIGPLRSESDALGYPSARQFGPMP